MGHAAHSALQPMQSSVRGDEAIWGRFAAISRDHLKDSRGPGRPPLVATDAGVVDLDPELDIACLGSDVGGVKVPKRNGPLASRRRAVNLFHIGQRPTGRP